MERRLGKGLEALIPDTSSKGKEKVAKIRLADIVPNPFQPRQRFDTEKMDELICSIREKGIIQPILVRLTEKGHELVAGERRWRAAQELQLEEIPAIVRSDINDSDSLEISLIENIQREELNPIEEANAYRELINRFDYTLEKVGQIMGKDKTTISNSLRLLTLAQEIHGFVIEGKISAGHAKALLSITSENKRKKIARMIVRKGISVRETEQIAQRMGTSKTKPKKEKNPETARLEEVLQHKLGTKVTIHQGKKRGRLEIHYYSNEDLQRLFRLILE
jgi:ParB family chromosome partitioning protein